MTSKEKLIEFLTSAKIKYSEYYEDYEYTIEFNNMQYYFNSKGTCISNFNLYLVNG